MKKGKIPLDKFGLMLKFCVMASLPKRMIIYTKDVVRITGRTERTARRILSQIRSRLKKARGAFVTIDEFCHHTGLRLEFVALFLI